MNMTLYNFTIRTIRVVGTVAGTNFAKAQAASTYKIIDKVLKC